jgi:predicted transposase/invertase (TIGR01784 family)
VIASKFLDPRNDVAFRTILGSEKNKDILIHFINDIMGFKYDEVIKDVTFLNPIQDAEIAHKKQSIVDVLCEAANGAKIIVEMQVSPSKGFEKRAQYYASKAYSRQLNQGQNADGLYANLKEVIFIAISEYKIFPQKPEYISRHIILDAKTYERDLKDFSFTFIELPKFPIEKIEDLKTIVEKWCYFFKYAAKTKESELERIIGKDEVIERAYEALNQFNWSESELIAYEDEWKRVMDNKAAEAFLIETAEARGLERGLEKGLKDGMEKAAINMLKEKLDDSVIKSVTGLSQDDLDKLKH